MFNIRGTNIIPGFQAVFRNGQFVLQPPDQQQMRSVIQRRHAHEDVGEARRRQLQPNNIQPLSENERLRINDAQRRVEYRQDEEPVEVFVRRNENAQRMRARRDVQRNALYLAARQDQLPELHYLGAMDKVCQFCGAKMFIDETNFKCCHNGKVHLGNIYYPNDLKELLVGDSNQSKNFQENIRKFNSSVAFASMGAKLVVPQGRGPPVFRINGQVCHRTGNLHPPPGIPPSFGQLYIYDGMDAFNERMARPENQGCYPEVMQTLQDIILRESPYAAAYKHMGEVEAEEIQLANEQNRRPSEVRMHLRSGGDRRRYNLPHHDEVAAVFVGEDGAPPLARDIVVYPRDRPLQDLPVNSPNLDPMVYPVFFPRGELGWSSDIPHVAEYAAGQQRRTTMLQYYTYRFAFRDAFSPILKGKRLLQQYAVDCYCKVESDRLNYIRQNQRNFRVEQYQGLIDYLENVAENRGLHAGRPVILPSSFQGGPRAMQQNYQDAMAMVTKMGKPDLFCTFTCNPKWKEITENLDNEPAHYRPDLITRVFNLKLKALLEDINKNGVLGKAISHLYVIEFQKRSLPHAHILIHLAQEDKLRNADDIDSLISAEIPDPEQEPELHDIIKSCMIHGPCGNANPNAVCVGDDGNCTKDFPKRFCEATQMNANGYPLYRRRNNGRTVRVRNVDLDNQWVVPYCPWLSKKYNAHINLEACTTIRSVKYLFKYVYKGHDRANVEINERLEHDEIKTYLDARYVSAPEALWRIFEFSMHEKSHTIKRLAVHLPDRHQVYFRAGEEEAAAEGALNDSHLTAWFKLNVEDPDARQYLYSNIPYHYVFHGKEKKWKKRKKTFKPIVARLYNARPSEGERFFLRVLLLHVAGATSFEYLRTYDGVVYDTFREACIARHLLQDDAEWHNTLEEASTFQMPRQLRQLFVTILTHCEPSNPLELWNTFKGNLCEDYLRTLAVAQAEQRVLGYIDNVLRQFGMTLTQFNLPELVQQVAQEEDDVNIYIDRADQVRPLLNEQQLVVADAILSAVSNVRNGLAQVETLFYLDGPAGTGKTFTYNYVIAACRARGWKVATAAYTGIAATLLSGGCTLHSLFRLPVPVLENSVCNITPASKHAEYLRSVDLFLIDEATMVSTHIFHAVDRLLKDICGSDALFGGKVLLWGGDFRQCLPVVKKAKPTDVIEVCLTSSVLWASVSKYSLTENMRARPEEQEFCTWLLQLGNGELPTKQSEPAKGSIEIPDCCVVPKDTSIISVMYDGLEPHEYATTAILTPTNDQSLIINNEVLDRLPGDAVCYYSADEVACDDEEERQNYPVDFLNSITPSGMPPHCLKLKAGAIIMLLRNLNIRKGLCNGTRLIVRELSHNFIKAEVLTGSAVGKLIFIPRVQLSPSDTGMPFVLKRRQLPIRLAYSFTINKSQGQTFDKIGLFLQKPCFSHGQLYVACSRAKAFGNVKIKVAGTGKQGYINGKMYTQNVVFPQVLL